jgi:DNA-binding beta-propeller fold protein YncE
MKESWMTEFWIARIPLAAAAAALALTGCGSTSPMMTEKPVTPIQAQGEMQGGQQPIAGATLQLYAVGTGGYGSAATALFSPAITTDSNGVFTFPSSYCPADASALVYLVGTGGMPAGAGTNITNSNVALMAALGPCNSVNASTHIHINELTTVAAVWALAPFMSGTANAYLNIGSSSTNATGIQLAFQAAEQVVNTSSGIIGGATLPAGATLPTQELNSLADILGQCINSSGGTEGDGSNCGKLFQDAPNTAGTSYPTDTITAALNIAQNPARNVSTLFNLVPPTPEFESVLTSAPTAWTVAIQYTGGGLNAPTAIAADQSGNIWVANSGASSGDYYVSEFNNLGSSLLGTGTSVGTGAPTGLAIDPNGNAWITVSSANSLLEVSSSGTLGSPITNSGLDKPTGLAIDGSGAVWVVNSAGNSVSVFSNTGTAISGSPFSGGGIASPANIAINGSANANCSDCN